MRSHLIYWLCSHNLLHYQFTSWLEEPFDSEPALALLLTSASFPVVLGDLSDVTWRRLSSMSEEFAEDASRYRARFQASSAHSDRANWPGKEAELTCFVIFCYSNPELRTLPPELGNLRECWQLRLTKLTLPGIPKHVRPGELTTESKLR